MEVVVLTDGWRRGIRHSFDYLNYSKSSELTARLDFRSSASYVTAYGGSTSKNLTNNKQAFRGKIFFFSTSDPQSSFSCRLTDLSFTLT